MGPGTRAAVGLGMAGLLLASLPWLGMPAFYETFLYLAFHWVVLATSWNILSGYSGYFSFGHGAFFGAGVYTTAVLAGKLDMPFFWTLPLAALTAAALGMAVGAVALRTRHVRGELFALLTLAVTFVLATLVLNTPIDGGQGVYLLGVALPALAPTASGTFYLMALALMILTLGIALWVYRSRWGIGLFAIHDDEDAAEALGVPSYRCKVLMFGLSCALAGVAGGIHALFVSYVTVGETFSILVPLTVVLMSVLGGTRHWFGPAVGAMVVTALLYAFTASQYAVAGRGAVGLCLVIVTLFMPQGITGWIGSLRTRRAKPAEMPPPLAPAKPHGAGDTLLQTMGVEKAFSGLKAVAGVDIAIRRGEILGLVGPNGSGKSTFINLLSGYLPADKGSIRFEGREIIGLEAHRVARLGIARTYQIPRPFANLSVLENVAAAAMFGPATLDRAEAEREARRWLAFTGLADRADRLPDDLNLHQRKFLEVARALAARPVLLCLDEALSGLTPSEIDEAIGLIRAIRDQGTTILFVEHVMRAVLALADRVVVLNFGRVIAEGEPQAVMRDPAVVEAYLGRPPESSPHV